MDEVGYCSWVKRSGSETDHSSLSSAAVKNEWNYTSIHPLRLHAVYRDFTFTLGGPLWVRRNNRTAVLVAFTLGVTLYHNFMKFQDVKER